ncbi:hypothetical protein BDZ88DRAFT_176487 [Geranomyces variabilis]|nr:hypothetical protein BDZ88DRAFT_176487 [Geranomyces variabilis]
MTPICPSLLGSLFRSCVFLACQKTILETQHSCVVGPQKSNACQSGRESQNQTGSGQWGRSNPSAPGVMRSDLSELVANDRCLSLREIKSCLQKILSISIFRNRPSLFLDIAIRACLFLPMPRSSVLTQKHFGRWLKMCRARVAGAHPRNLLVKIEGNTSQSFQKRAAPRNLSPIAQLDELVHDFLDQEAGFVFLQMRSCSVNHCPSSSPGIVSINGPSCLSSCRRFRRRKASSKTENHSTNSSQSCRPARRD